MTLVRLTALLGVSTHLEQLHAPIPGQRLQKYLQCSTSEAVQYTLLSGASGGASGACGAPPSGLILFSLCWNSPLVLSLRTCTTTISAELLRKELHKYSSSQSRLRHFFASCQPVGAEIIEFSLCLSLSGLALLHPQPLHSGLQLWVQLLLISLGRQWLGHSEKQIRPGDLTQHHAGSGQSRIAPLEGPVGKLLGKS